MFVFEPCCPAHIALHTVLFVLVILSKWMNEWMNEWTGLRSFGDHKYDAMNARQLVSFGSCACHGICSDTSDWDAVYDHRYRGLGQSRLSRFLACGRPSWLSVSSSACSYIFISVCTSDCNCHAFSRYTSWSRSLLSNVSKSCICSVLPENSAGSP